MLDSQMIRLMLMLVLLACAPAMAWVSVGSSPGFGTCDYDSLQDAVDDGDNEIRVVNTQDYVENVVIAGSRTIRGGFNSCLAASLDLQDGDSSVVDGSGSSLFPTLWLVATGHVDLVLEKLRLTGGATGLHSGAAHGVIRIENSLIVANSGVDGAGLAVGNPGDVLQVVIRDSSLLGNEASGDGGGIHCASPNGRIRLESGAILENSAGGDGGGVYVGNGCRFTSYAGTSATDGSVLAGVVDNQAGGRGGGVFAGSGAAVIFNGALGLLGTVGNLDQPASLQDNQALGRGGGVFATGDGTGVTFTDALVFGNSSGGPGGALGLEDGAVATIGVSGPDCWGGRRCSVFEANRVASGVRQGGHVHAASGAQLSIAQSYLTAARADQGVAIYARDAGTSVHIEGSYLTGNGAQPDASWSDNEVIRLFAGATASLLHATIAGNDVAVAAIGIRGASTSLEVDNSVIFNPSVPVLTSVDDAQSSFDCIVVNENGSTGFIGLVADPLFRDSSSDFRLGPASQAIDRCADAGAVLPDSEHQARGQDDPDRPNFLGPYDAGADEAIFGDRIFSDRFGS